MSCVRCELWVVRGVGGNATGVMQRVDSRDLAGRLCASEIELLDVIYVGWACGWSLTFLLLEGVYNLIRRIRMKS